MLAVITQTIRSALLVKGIPKRNVMRAPPANPKSRKAFLRWGRDEQFVRAQDRERFREEMTRAMHHILRNHHAKQTMNSIQNNAQNALFDTFGKIKTRMERMKDHTLSSLNDLLALT